MNADVGSLSCYWITMGLVLQTRYDIVYTLVVSNAEVL